MRRILFIMQLPPPVHGVSIMNRVIRESKLINASFSCDYVNLATASDVNDIQKNRPGKYLKAFAIYFTAFRKMAFKRYDQVYITPFSFGAGFYKDALMVMLAKLLGQKPILHIHTFGFRAHGERSRVATLMARRMFRNVTVICISPLVVPDITPYYKGEVFILPNATEQVNFSNTYSPNEKPVILFLSNLLEFKGVLLLIEAAKILAARGFDFKVRIAGPEGDVTYDQLGKLVAENGLKDKVSLAGGPKFGQEKYDEFRRADIFTLPSRMETFGLVLIEAMQFGVPCVASNTGGIPDVIGQDRGLLLQEITAAELAAKLEILLNDPAKRLQISKAAFGYFCSNFTLDVFESRLKRILSGEAARNHVAG
jgi:glycosyltransferase involved in cell wall biosynthesis